MKGESWLLIFLSEEKLKLSPGAIRRTPVGGVEEKDAVDISFCFNTNQTNFLFLISKKFLLELITSRQVSCVKTKIFEL